MTTEEFIKSLSQETKGVLECAMAGAKKNMEVFGQIIVAAMFMKNSRLGILGFATDSKNDIAATVNNLRQDCSVVVLITEAEVRHIHMKEISEPERVAFILLYLPGKQVTAFRSTIDRSKQTLGAWSVIGGEEIKIGRFA
jgi:hypothetical protein